ncbi:MAG: MBL fold metallo-hydrolase [Pseudomonadota bacterium]
MRPTFHPRLVNDAFGDPGLYVEFLFEKRALLFDLGELRALAPRKLLRVSHVFVSHTHMDHFTGFDHLLRVCLGRDKRLSLFGPPGFAAQVEHKLAAYTWNLVQSYPADLTVEVTEAHPEGPALKIELHCREAFQRKSCEALLIKDGVLLDEHTLRVRAAFLDHKIPCLAFTLEEKQHVNIWKNRLEEMGLPVGPWLHELKQAVMQGAPDDTLFKVRQRMGDMVQEKSFPLRALKENILRIVPGQKITYVTDVIYHAANAKKIVDLAHDSDYLFIEATFLQQDAAHAAAKYHLTAHQAGTLARLSGAQRVIPFHFSPKYAGQEELLKQELQSALSA